MTSAEYISSEQKKFWRVVVLMDFEIISKCFAHTENTQKIP